MSNEPYCCLLLSRVRSHHVPTIFTVVSIAFAMHGQAAGEEFNTDWLAPPLQINADWADVCRVELTIGNENEGSLDGTMIIYAGEPSYNSFGDADKSKLRQKKIRILLTKTDGLTEGERGTRSQWGARTLYQLSSKELPIDSLQLVVSREELIESRLLVVRPNKRTFAHIVPLQSKKLSSQAKQYASSDPNSLNLRSERKHISGNSPDILFNHDPNHYRYNRFGDIIGATLLASPYYKIKLIDLQETDPTGQGRRLFRCEIGSPLPPFQRIRRESTNQESPVETLLVLHPFEGGWHRLLVRKSGEIEQIRPMYSVWLRSWSRLKANLAEADPIEREVFQRVSKEFPYFSSFEVQDGHIVGAQLNLSGKTRSIMRELVHLPYLAKLRLQGDCTTGEQLGQLTSLENLYFTHGTVSNEALVGVGKLRNLKSLTFRSVRLDCKSLKHLSSLHELTSFTFRQGEPAEFALNYDDRCLDFLSSSKNIKHLFLDALPLTAEAVKKLPVSSKIEFVYFNKDVPFLAVLEYAQKIPQATVSLSGARLKLSEGVLRVPRNISDDDIRSIVNIDGLTTLLISHPEKLTDAGLANLVGMKIKQLTLQHAQNITDSGIAHLSKIQTLESINLGDCRQLSDASIAHLKQLPNLRKVKRRGTQIDLDRLSAALPQCEVE